MWGEHKACAIRMRSGSTHSLCVTLTLGYSLCVALTPRHSGILGLRLCRDSRLMQHCDLPQSLSRLKLPATPPTGFTLLRLCGWAMFINYLLVWRPLHKVINNNRQRLWHLQHWLALIYLLIVSIMYSNLCSDHHTHTDAHTLEFASSLLQLSSPRQSIGKIVGAALIKLINKWKRCAEWRD